MYFWRIYCYGSVIYSVNYDDDMGGVKMKKFATFGDQLAEEIYNQIVMHKLQVVGTKIRQYYESFEDVDIPGFMKRDEEHLDNIVTKELKRIVYDGKLEHFYNLAVQNESEV